MNEEVRPEAHLSQFLQDIYGDLSCVTRAEVDVEEQSGGAHGTPHREAIQVRVYVNDESVFPDIQTVPYWKEVLKTVPDVFTSCRSLQECGETMMRFLADEQIYLEYGLDWPATPEKVVSPLCFSMKELRFLASQDTEEALEGE